MMDDRRYVVDMSVDAMFARAVVRLGVVRTRKTPSGCWRAGTSMNTSRMRDQCAQRTTLELTEGTEVVKDIEGELLSTGEEMKVRLHCDASFYRWSVVFYASKRKALPPIFKVRYNWKE